MNLKHSGLGLHCSNISADKRKQIVRSDWYFLNGLKPLFDRDR